MALPLPELSVRAPLPEGTDVAVRVLDSPVGYRPSSHRVVVFIHGYNNTHAVATESYGRFRELLEEFGVKSPSLTGEICAVHWPGNVHLGFLSFVSYPTEIKPATRSGKLLAGFLADLRGPQGSPLEIFLVCHSLGNRVGLELLAEIIHLASVLPNPTPNRFAGFCLMAAAVPVGHVDDGKLAAAARCTRTLVLHSRGDLVLRLAFPIGQTVAGDGFFPQAVGRLGRPPGAWTERADLSPYGHSDYWRSGDERKPDKRSARKVAAFLGVPVMLEPAANALVAHSLPPAVETSENSVPVREIPSRKL